MNCLGRSFDNLAYIIHTFLSCAYNLCQLMHDTRYNSPHRVLLQIRHKDGQTNKGISYKHECILICRVILAQWYWGHLDSLKEIPQLQDYCFSSNACSFQECFQLSCHNKEMHVVSQTSNLVECLNGRNVVVKTENQYGWHYHVLYTLNPTYYSVSQSGKKDSISAHSFWTRLSHSNWLSINTISNIILLLLALKAAYKISP